jgi:5-oxoprolinase (ATP-hydrolysing)
LVQDGNLPSEVVVAEKLIFVRLKGQETSIEVHTKTSGDVKSRFRNSYMKMYGYWIEGREIEVESIRVRLEIKGQDELSVYKSKKKYKPDPINRRKIFVSDRWMVAGVFLWEGLQPGATIDGPSLIVSNNSTQYIEPDWTFQLDANNNGCIRKMDGFRRKVRIDSEEAQLELYTNRFTSIAQNMGAMLQRTAFSVNVKERLDFSCALLDQEGNLIVNAPHIPVHLGSLGVCVRALAKAIPMKQGDVIITNHPGYGGSHLPDITLVKPVFYKEKLVGYVANRAHHAEIGGIQPGSTPAQATRLEQEGVIIHPTYLIKSNEQQWDDIQDILLTAKYPTRAIHENVSDLGAALAALTLGDAELISLCQQYSSREIIHYMSRQRCTCSPVSASERCSASARQ